MSGLCDCVCGVVTCNLSFCRCLFPPERQKRKRNWEENDYYDSDEDTFLDRTGSSEWVGVTGCQCVE